MSNAGDAAGESADTGATPMRTVVLASSTGTAFEWYDFFVYGAVASVISRNFFSELDPTSGLIAALALFAAGFLFRPVGALFFGRLGDRFGRKGAFLATVILMGGATFAIGLLPTYAQAGGLGTMLLIFLRILQGMAVGGEYGGAATYVAEHAHPDKRGQSTSWIQSSASSGLVGALLVVLVTRSIVGEEAFVEWGWRIPFLLSAGLLGVSIWMRMKLKESPEFERVKAEGKTSAAPFADVFLKWSNVKYVIIGFFSLMLAQGAIWFCVFFYVQVFMESFMRVEPALVNYILVGATLVSIPLYTLFGWLSDRVGRKPVILMGIGLGTLAIIPAFHLIAGGANPALARAQEAAPVTLHADPATCSFQFDLLGKARYVTGCDIARNMLTKSGVAFTTVEEPAGSGAEVHVSETTIAIPELGALSAEAAKQASSETDASVRAALLEAGYPAKADSSAVNWISLALGFGVLLIAATALYGPLAATMVELFPTNIRYTALSVPYHIGVGWVGGFMPMTAFAISAATGDIFAGLWYSVAFAGLSFVCCLLLFPETRGKRLDRDVA